MSVADDQPTNIELRNAGALTEPLSVQEYVHRATADNTRKAYQQDIRHFERWGGRLPADTATVIRYCREHASTINPRTLQRRLVALKQFHLYQGFPDPTDHPLVRKTLRGIQNTHGVPKRKAPALMLCHVEQLLDHLATSTDLAAYRNTAMIALGFFGALRGSELVHVQREHLELEPEGLTLLIPRSKTDPTGQGQTCAIPALNNPYCPLKALQHWLDQSGIASGHLFRGINQWQQLSLQPLSLDGFNKILRQLATDCQLPEPHRYSSHSLRRGLATSASAAGASFKSIMRQGRWRHEGTVLEYIEDGQKFQDNAVTKLFDA